jgi:subtilase family serine protease
VKSRSFYLALALPSAALFAGAASAASTDIFARIVPPANVQESALADSTPMHVVVTLPLADEAGAVAFAKAVSDPGNRQYGHYITPGEYGARFGSDPAAFEAVRQWGTAHGLSVDKAKSARSSVTFGGTAGQFAALFNTRFASFPGQNINPVPPGRVGRKDRWRHRA